MPCSPGFSVHRSKRVGTTRFLAGAGHRRCMHISEYSLLVSSCTSACSHRPPARALSIVEPEPSRLTVIVRILGRYGFCPCFTSLEDCVEPPDEDAREIRSRARAKLRYFVSRRTNIPIRLVSMLTSTCAGITAIVKTVEILALAWGDFSCGGYCFPCLIINRMGCSLHR